MQPASAPPPAQPPDPRYDPRDLLRLPCLLSLVRVPLALCFPFVVHRPAAALGVLGAAGLSDVLDGWVARRLGQCTPLGAVLDGATDKVFVFVVAGTLLATHRLGLAEMLLLGARDLVELGLAAVIALRGDARALHEEQRADHWGKAATFVQFVAVVLAITAMPGRALACAVAGALGLVAAAGYVRRAL